jgi:hypothetical protein
MNYEMLNAVACGLIGLWATRCVLSGKVRDGVVDKIIYAVIAISGYAILARNDHFILPPTAALCFPAPPGRRCEHGLTGL